MPAHLLEAAEAGRLVVFAGAGISTENSNVFPESLLDDVRLDLGKGGQRLGFAEAMSAYCDRPDGRALLLGRIRRRFEYVEGHPELYATATAFHRELATIWQVKDIITTNWDLFFERECGAVPFISDRDLAFWSQADRRVLKLHGSVHSLGDIVVTAEDYRHCFRRLTSGLLGSHLKTLLADRTIVFIGYSLRDSDLRRILASLGKQLGELRPTYYLVSPEVTEQSDSRLARLQHIKTDGAFFLRSLKHELQKFEHSLSDARFARLPLLRRRVADAHVKLFDRRPIARHPETVYCAAYQDGLMHAIDRALALAHTGRYSHLCDVERLCGRYDAVRRARLREGDYWDAAYAEGYLNGLIFLSMDADTSRSIPLFFVFGSKSQVTSFAAYERQAAGSATLHRAAFRCATRLAQKFGSYAVHHTPFLNTGIEDDEPSPRGSRRHVMKRRLRSQVATSRC
jgi:hypothetical protein